VLCFGPHLQLQGATELADEFITEKNPQMD